MHILIKQYILSCYADGTIRITERAVPKHNAKGKFIGKQKIIVCPVCGANLVVKEVRHG